MSYSSLTSPPWRRAALVVCVVLLTLSAQAADLYWVASTPGVWSDPANWSLTANGAGGAGAPAPMDEVHFSQHHSAPCSLTSDATCASIVTSGYLSVIDLAGHLLFVNGNTNSIIEEVHLTDGVGGGRLTINTSGNMTFSEAEIDVDVSVSADRVFFDSSIFDNDVRAEVTGTGGHSSAGGNLFRSELEIYNNGNGWTLMARYDPDIYLGDVYLINNSPSRIRMSFEPMGTEYHGDIIVMNTGGGVWFGENGGSSTLMDGRTISVGPAGFDTGELRLQQFHQIGGTPQNITLSGDARINMSDHCHFEASVNLDAPQSAISECRVDGDLSIRKTGAVTDVHNGGNVYGGDVMVINESGSLNLAHILPDTVAGDMEFINEGIGYLSYAGGSAGNVIHGDMIGFNNGLGAVNTIMIAHNAGSSLRVNGHVSLENNGSGDNKTLTVADLGEFVIGGDFNVDNGGTATVVQTNLATGAVSQLVVEGSLRVQNRGNGTTCRMYLANAGHIAVGDSLIINERATASNTGVYVSHGASAVGQFDGPIVLSADEAAALGIRFGHAGGRTTFSAAAPISIIGSYTARVLDFRNVEILSPQQLSLALSETSILYFMNSQLSGDLTAVAGRQIFNTTTYLGDVSLTKIGAGNDANTGGNLISGDLELISRGEAYLMTGNIRCDSIMGNVRLTNYTRGNLFFAHNSTSNFIGGDLLISARDSARNILVQSGQEASLHVAGDALIESTTHYISRVGLAINGPLRLDGDLRADINGSNLAANLGIAENNWGRASIGGEVHVELNGNADAVRFNCATNGQVDIGGDFTLRTGPDILRCDTYLANTETSQVSINGHTSISNNGQGFNSRVFVGFSGKVSLLDGLTIDNSSSATNSEVSLSRNASGRLELLGDLDLRSTVDGCDGIFFGQFGGTSTFSEGAEIEAPLFISGNLMFRNVEMRGDADHDLSLTGTSVFWSDNSQWSGNATIVAPSIYTQHSRYPGDASFTKTGSINNSSRGGNHIAGRCIWKNTGVNYLLTGRFEPDSVLGDLHLIVQNVGGLHWGYSSADNFVGRDLYADVSQQATQLITNNLAGTSMHIVGDCNLSCTSDAGVTTYLRLNNQGSMTIGGDVDIYNGGAADRAYVSIGHDEASQTLISGDLRSVNDGSGVSKRVLIGHNGLLRLRGELTLDNRATATESLSLVAVRPTAMVDLESDVTLISAVPESDGIQFGASMGRTRLAPGADLIADAATFTSGMLHLRNFSRLGGPALELDLPEDVRFNAYSSVFESDVTVEAGRILLRESEFEGVCSFTKTGTANDASVGGNVFYDEAVFTQSASGYLMPSNGLSNTYHGDVSYLSTTTARVYDAHNSPAYYHGDIYFDLPNAETFAAGANGRMVMVGTTDQTISGSTPGAAHIFGVLVTQKPSGELIINTPLQVSRSLELRDGLIQTSLPEHLSIRDNASTTGASNDSYVDGPMQKRGNDAFVYPIGAGGRLRPIGMSAPSTGGALFNARYYPQDPGLLYDRTLKDDEIIDISPCEYWTLDRVASNSSVAVQLYYDQSTSCASTSTIDSLAVCRWDGNLWDYHGGQNYSGSSAAASFWSEDQVTQFSPFAIGKRLFQSPLPIELLSFSAEVEGERVRLEWTTASEIDNDRFVLERSLDGHDWRHLGTVDGAGNSSVVNHYTLMDESPHKGRSYYRLTQIDFDGSSETFTPSSVYFGDEQSQVRLRLYPNPTSHDLHIDGVPSDAIAWHVISASGSKVLSGRMNEHETSILSVDISPLRAGVYRLVIDSATEVQAATFVKE